MTVDSTVLDTRGRELPAIKVFACAIRYFVDHLFDDINRKNLGPLRRDDIYWVLTVPAIWDDRARKFMRDAAHQVSITKNMI